MKIRSYSSANRQRWLKKPIASYSYHPWLVNSHSLTTRLKNRYTDFNVKPLTVQLAKVGSDEAQRLHLPSYQQVLMRNVLLNGGQQAVVFAHSILPLASLRGDWADLGLLGRRPLGATLFANPKVKRTPLEYKKLSSTHFLYQSATQHLATKPNFLWARRSVFSLNCANILVTEVFLPDLIKDE